MTRVLTIVSILIISVIGVSAQTEADLKQYFEGTHVTLRMDMPATKDGVNVYPERAQPIDYNEYGNRLKRHGVSIRRGDEIMITRIKLKDKHIEFQLGGGGYGTFGDDTDTSVSVPNAGKSRREKNLEDEIKRENDPKRKKRLKDELDDLRRERERDNELNRRIAAEAEESRRARIEQKALQGGSRFNIYFSAIDERVLTPQNMMEVLRKYVEFSNANSSEDASTVKPTSYGTPEPSHTKTGVVQLGPRSTYLKEGLSLSSVLRVLGTPTAITERNDNGKIVVSYEFMRGGGRTVVAEFVNNVLIHAQTVAVDEVKPRVTG